MCSVSAAATSAGTTATVALAAVALAAVALAGEVLGIEMLRLMEKCASILGMPVAFQMATRRTVDAWLHSEWFGTSAIATVSTGATTTMTAARVASTRRSRC